MNVRVDFSSAVQPVRAPVAGRTPVGSVHLFEDHDTSYDLWKRAGVKDRILVHFDGHLDFWWIADKTSQDILNAQSGKELDRLLAESNEWNLDGRSFRDQVHIGNYLYPAIREGMIKAFYWVIPEPFWFSKNEYALLKQFLAQMARERPQDCGPVTETGTGIELSVLGCPLTICTLENLPRFEEAVLFDFDVDYLTTLSARETPPYFRKEPVKPWLWPSKLFEQLGEAKIPTDFVTIAYSVNGGFTPMRYKHFGDIAAWKLKDPDVPVFDGPLPGTAGEIYERFLNAWESGDLFKARTAWEELIEKDPTYRNTFALPGWRDESLKQWNEAQRTYELMNEIDPGWHYPYLGRGRCLFHRGKRREAEAYFQMACILTQEPTMAWHWLALCAFCRKDFDLAEAAWRKSVERNPQEPHSWQGLARLAALRGEDSQVIEYAKKSLALGLNANSNHGMIARSAWRLGQRRLAWKAFQTALKGFFEDVKAAGIYFIPRLLKKGSRKNESRRDLMDPQGPSSMV